MGLLPKFRLKGIKGQATAIGRMDDLVKYKNIDNVDTWWKTGRIPGPNDKRVTWTENRLWLEDRIKRGDTFIMTMDPSKLPTEFIENTP